MRKISLQEACAQIAQLPEATLTCLMYSYSGLSVSPRIKSERPSIYMKGTGAEISASLLEQEVTTYSRNGTVTNQKLQTLDGKVEVKQSLTNGRMSFSVDLDINDPRHTLLFLISNRMVRYSYIVYGTSESVKS